jgi:hypothetical protein
MLNFMAARSKVNPSFVASFGFCLQVADGAGWRNAVFHPADRVTNQGVVALQVQPPFDLPAVTGDAANARQCPKSA